MRAVGSGRPPGAGESRGVLDQRPAGVRGPSGIGSGMVLPAARQPPQQAVAWLVRVHGCCCPCCRRQGPSAVRARLARRRGQRGSREPLPAHRPVPQGVAPGVHCLISHLMLQLLVNELRGDRRGVPPLSTTMTLQWHPGRLGGSVHDDELAMRVQPKTRHTRTHSAHFASPAVAQPLPSPSEHTITGGGQ